MRAKFAGQRCTGREEAKNMQHIVRGVPLLPTSDEQARARAEFWDAVQKPSMLLGLVVAIRSLRK